MEDFKSGFVGVMGQPNVGKSTLMNAFLKQKLSIVSPKPQTTRNRIMGILTEEKYQCIFWDTPGIITTAKSKLDEYMINVSYGVPQEVDLIIYLIDPYNTETMFDKSIIKKISKSKKPIILVINKIDKYDNNFIENLVLEYKKIHSFDHIILISALQKTNIDKLVSIIVEMLPIGPQYFSSDMITEHPERFFISEIIREKILELTMQEVPYAVAVKVEEVKERRIDLVYVKATIHVERDSQKGIIIGNQGSMLKNIGLKSRIDIEDLLNAKVFLELHVKVKKNWRKDSSSVRYMGYE